MKINKLVLTTAIALCSLSAWSQSNSAGLIKNNYPQVYSSIVKNAVKQWDGDAQLQRVAVEGQSQAFLAVLDMQNSVGDDLLRNAIVKASLPGTEESNLRILNNPSIDNPLPLLQCDWYKVQIYLKNNGNVDIVSPSIDNNTRRSNSALATSSTRTSQKESTPFGEDKMKSTQVNESRYNTVVDVNKEAQEPAVEQTASSTRNRRTQQAVVDNEPVTASSQRRTSNSTPSGSTSETAQSQYERNQSSYARPTRNASANSSIRSSTTENARTRRYTNRNIDDRNLDRRSSEQNPFSIGAKVGVGLDAMYNMGNYTNKTITYEGVSTSPNLQVKSSASIAAEAGVVFNYQKNGLFLQNETTLQYMVAKFTNKIYEAAGKYNESPSYSNKYWHIRTAFHVGGSFEAFNGMRFVAGVGPYVAFKVSASYDKFGIFGETTGKPADLYERYMKGGEKNVNFGLSGIFGLDINKSRIALYPSIGLSKMQESEDYKPFGVTLGYTYFFR